MNRGSSSDLIEQYKTRKSVAIKLKKMPEDSIFDFIFKIGNNPNK